MSTISTFPPILPSSGHRVYFDHSQLMVMKRWLRDEGTTFIEGQDSLYVLSSRHKYINKDVCKAWETLDGQRVLLTPGEIARVELERAFGRKADITEKGRLDLLGDTAPRFWDGEIREDWHLFYTDLSGAYWQCWRLLTLDCVWPRGMGQLDMFEMGERLKDYKPGRNAVAGITMAHHSHMFHKGAWKDQPFYNPWFNPAIWKHLQAFVHEVASIAVSLGCCYIATDGYIFPDWKQWATFNAYLEDHDLAYKTEQGDGYVTAWASYKIGAKQTKRKKYLSVLNHHNVIDTEGMVKWMLKRKRTLLAR